MYELTLFRQKICKKFWENQKGSGTYQLELSQPKNCEKLQQSQKGSGIYKIAFSVTDKTGFA